MENKNLKFKEKNQVYFVEEESRKYNPKRNTKFIDYKRVDQSDRFNRLND